MKNSTRTLSSGLSACMDAFRTFMAVNPYIEIATDGLSAIRQGCSTGTSLPEPDIAALFRPTLELI